MSTIGLEKERNGGNGKKVDEIVEENVDESDQTEEKGNKPKETVDTSDQTAGNSNINKDITLNITKVITKKEITYGWNLEVALVADDNKLDNSALFQVQATRYEEANELTISVEAELDQESTVDTIKVDLGNTVNNSFETIKTFEVSEFNQITADGVTEIHLDIIIDFLDFNEDELDLLQKVRLSIPVEKKKGQTAALTATHELSLSDTPETVINAEAEIETDLLDALEEFGTTDATVDDWFVELNEYNLFENEIEIIFDEIQDAKDMVVTVNLIGDDSKILRTIKVTLASGQYELLQNIWTGDFHHIHGFWMPPLKDDFVLGRKAVPVSFWLKEAPAEELSLRIFEATSDNNDEITIKDQVAVMTQDKVRTASCGKRGKTWGGNQPGVYYKFILKARNLPLKEDRDYVLAVMIGDDMLAFDEETPAMLSFTVAEGEFKTRWAEKLNSRRYDSNGNR